MKLFRLLTTTAITTMAVAAMTVSASALEAKYNEATTDEAGTVVTGSVTLDGITSEAEQKTLLVLNNDVFGDFDKTAAKEEGISNTDIVQIDQDASFGTVVVGDLQAAMNTANAAALATYEKAGKTTEAYETLKENWQASKTYYVRVGGDGSIETAMFTVETTAVMPDAEPVAPAYTLGDVNIDTLIDMGDAAAVLNHYTGDAVITDATAKLAADVNIDTLIDMGDAAAILNHYTGDALIVQPQ